MDIKTILFLIVCFVAIAAGILGSNILRKIEELRKSLLDQIMENQRDLQEMKKGLDQLEERIIDIQMTISPPVSDDFSL